MKSSDQTGKQQIRLFILQGFFNAERRLFETLSKYYESSFNAKLIGFPRDYQDYAQQKGIIEKWVSELDFNPMALADELAALDEELS